MSRSTHLLEDALLRRRTPRGGLASVATGPPDVEATAIGLLAMRSAGNGFTEPAEEAGTWLVAQQLPQGAWPVTKALPEPSWATAWCVLALLPEESAGVRLDDAGRWLVAREGRRPPWWARALGRWAGEDERLQQDLSLRGWPWHGDAASWVEPTAISLLALRLLDAGSPIAGAPERVDEGRRLLLDRMCVGGGWNYGNRRVLGEALPPYPDTTAISLLALQGLDVEVTGPNLDALEEGLAGTASSLGLALGALALELHERSSDGMLRRLDERVRRRGPPSATRSIALALLALEGGSSGLRIPS
jgi:hypothetical protein